ncbi:MAG TPA: aromatic ring-hydroxylating dioxygenase subunit alpha [Steroidobacteraceae bacterium]|nr:aromatic ring-hydroxylating dioxygenase subunit alpha [Steroidobacteraceae bacterium]
MKNAWYVAAQANEITPGLHSRTILGEPVAIYRQRDRTPVALEDACPHRKLPLSMGRVVGDLLECGYHGLTFDAGGRCVRIPGADFIPKGARVRSYPLIERNGLLWIWMGPAELADPRMIFAVEHWGDSGWGTNSSDAMHVDAHYLFVTDNLLDPSHVAWVHRGSFGDESCEAGGVQVTATEAGVIASRWMRNVEVAPFYKPFVRFSGLCDRLQHYEVRFPSHAIVKAVIVPAGAAGAHAEQHPQAFVMHSYNFLTPVDEQRTLYYWFQVRNFAPGDAAVSELMNKAVRAVFEEDRIILKAVHEGFTHKRSSNIDLGIDSAPLRFRRRLSQLISAEQTAPAGST